MYHKIAKELLLLARCLISMEFDTKEEMDEYKKTHDVRRTTRLTVRKNTKTNNEKPDKSKKVETKKDEWLDKPFSKERTLYHGTSKNGWKKIQDSGHLEPREADNTEHGAAVWFTTKLDEAKTYAKNGGVILSIKHGDAEKYKHHRYSPLSPDMVKDFKKKAKNKDEIDKINRMIYDFDFVVHEKIPVKNVSIVSFGKNRSSSILATELLKIATEINPQITLVFERNGKEERDLMGVQMEMQKFVSSIRKNEELESVMVRQDDDETMKLSIGFTEHESKEAIIREIEKLAGKLAKRNGVKVETKV